MKTLFKNMYYAFVWRFIPKHQYNKVHLDLTPAFYDHDDRLRKAIFKIADEYLNEAESLLQLDLSDADALRAENFEEDEIDHYKQMLEVRQYYSKDRDYLIKQNREAYNTSNYKRIDILERDIESLDKKYMKMVIDNYEKLWI